MEAAWTGWGSQWEESEGLTPETVITPVHSPASQKVSAVCKLCTAIEEEDLRKVKRLIQADEDDCLCPCPRPVYRLIALYRRFLVQHRATEVEACSLWKSSAVFQSTTRILVLEAVAKLLAGGAAVNYTTGIETPLTATVSTCDVELLWSLLDYRADVNLKDGRVKLNALGLAILLDQEHLVKLLIQHGGKVNAPCCSDLYPLQLAMNKTPALSSLLLQSGASLQGPPHLPLPFNARLQIRQSPLMVAVQAGDLPLASLLLLHGEDVNQTFPDTLQSPVFVAIANRDLPMLRVLVRFSADLNRPNFDQQTPLGVALMNAHPDSTEIAKVLVRSGASAFRRTRISYFQKTYCPLHIACFKGNLDFVRFLVEEVCGEKGETQREKTREERLEKSLEKSLAADLTPATDVEMEVNLKSGDEAKSEDPKTDTKLKTATNVDLKSSTDMTNVDLKSTDTPNIDLKSDIDLNTVTDFQTPVDLESPTDPKANVKLNNSLDFKSGVSPKTDSDLKTDVGLSSDKLLTSANLEPRLESKNSKVTSIPSDETELDGDKLTESASFPHLDKVEKAAFVSIDLDTGKNPETTSNGNETESIGEKHGKTASVSVGRGESVSSLLTGEHNLESSPFTPIVASGVRNPMNRVQAEFELSRLTEPSSLVMNVSVQQSVQNSTDQVDIEESQVRDFSFHSDRKETCDQSQTVSLSTNTVAEERNMTNFLHYPKQGFEPEQSSMPRSPLDVSEGKTSKNSDEKTRTKEKEVGHEQRKSDKSHFHRSNPSQFPHIFIGHTDLFDLADDVGAVSNPGNASDKDLIDFSEERDAAAANVDLIDFSPDRQESCYPNLRKDGKVEDKLQENASPLLGPDEGNQAKAVESRNKVSRTLDRGEDTEEICAQLKNAHQSEKHSADKSRDPTDSGEKPIEGKSCNTNSSEYEVEENISVQSRVTASRVEKDENKSTVKSRDTDSSMNQGGENSGVQSLVADSQSLEDPENERETLKKDIGRQNQDTHFRSEKPGNRDYAQSLNDTPRNRNLTRYQSNDASDDETANDETDLSRRVARFVNQSGADGSTALFMAVYDGNEELVEYLLEKGADPFFSCHHGNFFHAAVFSQSVALLRRALGLGCCINELNLFGNSPLTLIARLDLPEACEFLVAHGADMDSRDRYGETPLLASVYFGCERNAEIFIRHGASLDLMDDNHTSAIYWAMFNNRQRTLRLLLKAGAHFTSTTFSQYPRNIRVMHNQSLCNYILSYIQQPRSLAELAVLGIRRHLTSVNAGRSILPSVSSLPLPSRLREMLTLTPFMEAIDLDMAHGQSPS